MAARSLKKMTGNMCMCPCHKFKKTIMGVFLIVFGLIFLLNNLGYSSESFTGLAWPVLILLLGTSFIVKGFFPCDCCNHH